tara:strand:- start:963 stop:1136 length:174 start_codon:yes stop_codon:yes gene_type:complete
LIGVGVDGRHKTSAAEERREGRRERPIWTEGGRRIIDNLSIKYHGEEYVFTSEIKRD